MSTRDDELLASAFRKILTSADTDRHHYVCVRDSELTLDSKWDDFTPDEFAAITAVVGSVPDWWEHAPRNRAGGVNP